MRAISITFFLAFAATLNASTILVEIDPTLGGDVEYTENSVVVTGYAGALVGTFDGNPLWNLFCVDLFTPIDLGTPYNSEIIAPRLVFNEDRVSWLYQNYIGTVTTVALGQGFQLAIWDIVHDNGDGIAAGSVQSSAGTPLDVQNAWLNFVSVSVGQSAITGVTVYENSSLLDLSPAQALMGAEMPEPGTWVLMGAGLLGLIASKRRRLA